MTETSHKKAFINAVVKKDHENMKNLKLKKFSCLIASAKFQSTMWAFHHPTLVGNYKTLYSDVFALSIQWMVYYLSVLRSVWTMRVVAVALVAFGYILAFESRNNMIKRFATRWQQDWRFTFFLGGPLDVLEVCDNERGMLRKKCCLEMC